jgi:hypothetical protein
MGHTFFQDLSKTENVRFIAPDKYVLIIIAGLPGIPNNFFRIGSDDK